MSEEVTNQAGCRHPVLQQTNAHAPENIPFWVHSNGAGGPLTSNLTVACIMPSHAMPGYTMLGYTMPGYVISCHAICYRISGAD